MANLAVIPARSGSKGLKNKNILPLANKPLMGWTIEAAIESNMFDVVHVSTDSKEYQAMALELGADVPFLRSLELSSDTASSWDVVREALSNYNKIGKSFDKCMLLQPTSPLRTSKNIIEIFNKMEEKNAEAVISVCESEHSPLWYHTLSEKGTMEDFYIKKFDAPRQCLKKYYRVNGAAYLFRIIDDTFNENLYSEKCYAYLMDAMHSVDIDSMLDFKIAETLIENGVLNND